MEYGIFYIKTVFPKGHKLEWLNYLQIGKYMPKDLSDLLGELVMDVNSKEGIIIPMDKSINAGCVTQPDVIEEIVNNVYNSYCNIFEKLTGDIDCIRLVWGIGEMDNVDYKSVHELPSYPIIVKIGRFLDSSKSYGIYQI